MAIGSAARPSMRRTVDAEIVRLARDAIVSPIAPDRYSPKHLAQTGSCTPARRNERSGR